VVDDIVIKVEQVSKKYCKSLKRSMLYGIEDIGRNMVGLSSRSDRLRKNEFWAVDDVSFELKKGETLGIIGPNGSGKTTLLKMLNGIFWPDKGKITVKGRVGALIEIGAGFHPLLTGRENIYINAAILGMTKKEVDSKFNDIVEFADIGDSLDTPVKFYSSGMFVRLGFAVAIHCRPDILLVDEILAVGDTDFRRKSADRMKDLITNNDCSIILVSHNMHSVTAIANKAILLNNGAILASGDVKNVVAQYDLMMRPGGKKKYSMSVFIDSEEEELKLVHTYGYAGGEVTIKRVWLESSNGECRTHFSGEEDVAVCISYKVNKDISIMHGFVWVAFINEYDVNCMGAQLSLGENKTTAKLPKVGILRVWFRPFQLTTSSYKISIAFSDKTYAVQYAQGHYGYVKVINDIPTFIPGLNTPVCWPRCEWNLELLDTKGNKNC
jgi:ABC-type polysaccharide/polyol phosphate transport system ATPase subunit